MKDYLETFELELTVKGPVFIGSGNEISKKEYLILERRSKVGILDVPKFYALVAKKARKYQFEEFMMNSDTRIQLEQWLSNNNITMQEARSCMKYVLDIGDTGIEWGRRIQIMQFVRDPYGLPYVPGSSVKGMLRTILLASRILIHPEKYAAEKRILKDSLLNGIKKIEDRSFRTLSRKDTNWFDAVNDELSGMIVSDSLPLKVDDLVLCQKLEGYTDGKIKPRHLLRECLRPGTKIKIPVTIDHNLCSVTKEEIMKAVRVFDDLYSDCFLNAFRGTDRLLGKEVYLGGGAGFLSKTIIYPLFGKTEGVKTTQKIFFQTGAPKRHKHEQDVAIGISPRILKYTKYDGQILEFGKCRLDIHEL